MKLDVFITEDVVRLAEAADRLGEFAAAAHHWRRAVETDQLDPVFIRRLITALDKAGQVADAEAWALLAVERFPETAHFVLESGKFAARRGDWPEVLRRLEGPDERFPATPWIAVELAQALCRMNRLEEAEAKLAAANRNGDHINIAVAHALHPTRRGDWAAAATRLRQVVARFPEEPKAHAQLGNALRLLNRTEEAKRLLGAAVARFPDAAAVQIGFAKLLDPGAADVAAHWRMLVERFPGEVDCHAGYGRALRRTGEAAAAETFLALARRRFPNDFQIASDHADLAADGDDLPEALIRWQRNVDRFTDLARPRERLAQIRWMINLQTIADAPGADAAAEATTHDNADAAVLARFENLGANCEFGLLQRRQGVEPLGLFRFAGVDVRSVIDLLETRFAGFGEPAFTELVVGDTGEYFTADTRYVVGAHTFVASHSVQREAFLQAQCRRLCFLKRKLLEDLEAAEKIFVFTAKRDSADEDGPRLHAALRKYGPTRLLYVRKAGAGEVPGQLRQVGDGLMFGYLDRLGDEVPGRWDISAARWLELCRRMLAACGD